MSLDLSLTKEEDILRQTTHDFMNREIDKGTLESLLASDTGDTEAIRKKVSDIGWFGIVVPEQYGGIGYPLTSAGVLFEALGSRPLPGPYFTSGILCSQILMASKDEDLKSRLLPSVADGTRILTLALSEADGSWNPKRVETTAHPVNGSFRISGTKLVVYDAMAATDFVVAARTDNGLSLFLSDANADGIAMKRLPGFLNGRAFVVTFNNVLLDSAALIGELDSGSAILDAATCKAVPVLCAYKVGGCQSVVDMALEYSRKRIQFGQPIGRFQRVQDMIIEMVNQTDAARWTTYEALWKLDTGRHLGESVHLAKAIASEAYWQVCTIGHRVFSGISYSMEHPLSYHTRTSRYLYHYLGDPGYHRQKIAQLLIDG